MYVQVRSLDHTMRNKCKRMSNMVMCLLIVSDEFEHEHLH